MSVYFDPETSDFFLYLTYIHTFMILFNYAKLTADLKMLLSKVFTTPNIDNETVVIHTYTIKSFE